MVGYCLIRKVVCWVFFLLLLPFALKRTKDTLASGQFLSVMNILMQLRKVCNHPNLFEPRLITSPFHITDDEVPRLEIPSLVAQASQPLLVAFQASAWTQACHVDWLDRAGAAARLLGQSANLAAMARDLPAFVARRVHQLRAKPGLISVVENSDPIDFGASLSLFKKNTTPHHNLLKLFWLSSVFCFKNLANENLHSLIVYIRFPLASLILAY